MTKKNNWEWTFRPWKILSVFLTLSNFDVKKKVKKSKLQNAIIYEQNQIIILYENLFKGGINMQGDWAFSVFLHRKKIEKYQKQLFILSLEK